MPGSIRVVRHMLPNHNPLTTEEFIAMSPPCSLALDGFCKDGPWFNRQKRRANLNHHDGCVRIVTLSTSMQMINLLRSGWRELFHDADGPLLNLFEDDCDEDVCGADFAAHNPHLVEHAINPMVNRYYQMTDIMDRHGGAYPLPADLPMLEAHAWTVEPYLIFRRTGGLDRKPKDPAEYAAVVEEVGGRISKHLMGNGGHLRLDTRYEVIRRGTGWTMVREIGSRARIQMYYDGIRAFVSVREGPGGNLAATIGVFDQCSRVSVPRSLNAWNLEDGLGPKDNRHGGGDAIGGTSKQNGTKMSIDRLFTVTEESALAEYATYES